MAIPCFLEYAQDRLQEASQAAWRAADHAVARVWRESVTVPRAAGCTETRLG
jgi:hypothetical protein